MAATSIFASLVAVVDKPVRISPFAMVLALVATAIGGRHRHLAAFAVGVAALCWVLGMTVAVLTGHSLY